MRRDAALALRMTAFVRGEWSGDAARAKVNGANTEIGVPRSREIYGNLLGVALAATGFS
jgi:hypothetical protein